MTTENTAGAVEKKIWIPTKAECDVILRAGVAESSPHVSRAKIDLQPGLRRNVDDETIESNINCDLVSKEEGDTDLDDHANWSDFKAGVTLTDAGTATVDFYIHHNSDAKALSDYGLLGNIVVSYANGKITKIMGYGQPVHAIE